MRWSAIGLVAVGGGIGAGCREGLSLAIPTLDAVLISIAIINVLGAFLLGWLYQAVTRLEASRAARLRLLLGTGFCGGFTTYSSLATDAAALLRDGHVGTAVAYALGTVLVGACATWLGILAGTSHHRSPGTRGHAGGAS